MKLEKGIYTISTIKVIIR